MDDVYSITLKGWLAVRAMNCKTLDDATKLWDDLTIEVKRFALLNGCKEGVPALVLEGKGYAITLIKQTVQ